MSQPVWKELHSLGDRGMIYVDTTGVYAPEAEIWEEYTPERGQKFDDDVCDGHNDEIDDWCQKTRAEHTIEAGGTGENVSPEACGEFTQARNRVRFLVFRFPLDRLYTSEDVEREWFARDLVRVADSVGETRETLVEQLGSDNPVERFWAYDAIGGYHGYDNFNSYPLDLSERGLEERQTRKEERAAEQARHRVQAVAQAIEPHGRCQRAGKCVEHAADRRVPSCRGTGVVQPRGKGRR